MVTVAMKLKDAPWKESCDEPRQYIKKQRHHFANKGPYSQSYSFSSSPVRMWELDHKEGWAQKNWCFQTGMLEKTLESPLDSKKIKLVNPKGNQPWIFIGRANAGTEPPTLWPPDRGANSLEKTLILGKIEGKRRGGQQRMQWLDSITYSMVMKSYGVNLNLTQGKGRTIQQNRVKGTGMGKKGTAFHLLGTKTSWFNKVLDYVYAHILWLVLWAKNYISIQNNSNDALCLYW